ncbi:hypothetical protein B0J13DRAFT_530441 [Dactylonectria estremocensis]|uniref:Uncharacterized protein n=1 Tax=Dactylonectria estremocensis TaxID=1079267 RepID=A0A9P9DXV7_9HYPO|nr:hypothetical protein B0J13DRAFT_530441 [Dactylonectria estremocensis]
MPHILVNLVMLPAIGSLVQGKTTSEISVQSPPDNVNHIPSTKDACRSFTKTYHHSAYPALDPSQTTLSAQDEVVFITGGSQDIGKPIINYFVLAKAEAVIITGRTKQTLAQTAHELDLAAEHNSAQTKALYYVDDVLDYVVTNKFLTIVRNQFGQVDMLINKPTYFCVPRDDITNKRGNIRRVSSPSPDAMLLLNCPVQ